MEFFGIGAAEFVALAVLAVLFFGPDKLPEIGRKAGRIVRYLKNIANDATTTIKSELGPEYQDLTVADLNPKTFLQKTLLADVQDDLKEIKSDLEGVRKDLVTTGGQATTAATAARDALNSELSSAQDAAKSAQLASVSAAVERVEEKLGHADALGDHRVRFDPEAT